MNVLLFGKVILQKLYFGYCLILRILVLSFAAMAGLSVFAMIIVTCADVIMRRFDRPIVGAYDIVKIAGAITLAAGLPYTTAVKGHVAIEYFFHKLNRHWRIVVDTVTRLMGITLFVFLAWRSFLYGRQLCLSGQVSQTLQMQVFWVPYVIGASCCIVSLVIFYNMLHPRRQMVKL